MEEVQLLHLQSLIYKCWIDYTRPFFYSIFQQITIKMQLCYKVYRVFLVGQGFIKVWQTITQQASTTVSCFTFDQ